MVWTEVQGLPGSSEGPRSRVIVQFYCEAQFAEELQRRGIEILEALADIDQNSAAEPFGSRILAAPFSSPDGVSVVWRSPDWRGNAPDEDALRWLMNDLNEWERRIVACVVAADSTGVAVNTLRDFGSISAETSLLEVLDEISERFRRVPRRSSIGPTESAIPNESSYEDREMLRLVLRVDHPSLATEVGLSPLTENMSG